MLTQMDGAEGLDGVYVLAATTRCVFRNTISLFLGDSTGLLLVDRISSILPCSVPGDLISHFCAIYLLQRNDRMYVNFGI